MGQGVGIQPSNLPSEAAQIQALMKYPFYLQFPTFELYNMSMFFY